MHVPIPEPSAAHRALAAFDGRFRGSESTPAGEAIGTYELRMGLGGFALLLDYEQRVGEAVRYAMHGVIGWEPVQERYYFHWYDSLGGLGTGLRGHLDNARLTLEGPDPVRGGRARFVFDRSAGGDGFELTMAFSDDGESWETVMAARYQRLH